MTENGVAARQGNLDGRTIASFDHEWASYDQAGLPAEERNRLFEEYFRIFPWDSLPPDAEGFDMGCGSGRWAGIVAVRVGRLHCIDPAPQALAVARRNLASVGNATFHCATTADAPLAPESQDFGYSLGVLHHIPDTRKALADCVRLLKPGAPFLVYLYYRFDDRPGWFRGLWKASELARVLVSRLPRALKNAATDIAAAMIYWPLARGAALADRFGRDVSHWPLARYRDRSFMTMRTDSRDRLGTPLEQRFTRVEIEAMMRRCGLADIRFSETAPFWVVVGVKGQAGA